MGLGGVWERSKRGAGRVTECLGGVREGSGKAPRGISKGSGRFLGLVFWVLEGSGSFPCKKSEKVRKIHFNYKSKRFTSVSISLFSML